MAKDYDPAGSMKDGKWGSSGMEDEPYGFAARKRDSLRLKKYQYEGNYGPAGSHGSVADHAESMVTWAERSLREAESRCKSVYLSRAEHSKVLDEVVGDVREMASAELQRYKMVGGV
jgi:hypothetical protein